MIHEYPPSCRKFPDHVSALDIIERLLSGSEVAFGFQGGVTFSICALLNPVNTNTQFWPWDSLARHLVHSVLWLFCIMPATWPWQYVISMQWLFPFWSPWSPLTNLRYPIGRLWWMGHWRRGNWHKYSWRMRGGTRKHLWGAYAAVSWSGEKAFVIILLYIHHLNEVTTSFRAYQTTL